MGSKTLPVPVPFQPSNQLANYSLLQSSTGLQLPTDNLQNIYSFSALHAIHLHQWTLGYPTLAVPRCPVVSKLPIHFSSMASIPILPHLLQPKQASAGLLQSSKIKPRFDFANLAAAATQDSHLKAEDLSITGVAAAAQASSPHLVSAGLGCLLDVPKVPLPERKPSRGRVPSKTKKEFICKFCGRHFTKSYNLLIHERTHTDERPYTCDICHKAFRRQDHLRDHSACWTVFKVAHNLSAFGQAIVKCTVLQRSCERTMETVSDTEDMFKRQMSRSNDHVSCTICAKCADFI